MAVDPSKVAFYFPPEINKGPKLALFERISKHIRDAGGRIIRGDHAPLERLPDDIVPMVGCSPQLTPMIAEWRKTGRNFLYWDRGYARRVYATWLPRGDTLGVPGGYYRIHSNAFQLQQVRDAPDDRWKALKTPVDPWRKGGDHIVIAAPTRTYSRFHRCETWIADTIDALARVTDRRLVIRDKESKRPLQRDLDSAHCLVTHGSIAAVEAVILGTPVFVHRDSAAALVGQTDLKKIETPVYPDRQPWLNALAYNQFNERELIDGTLWRLLE
jgi:hypothetical protein